MKPDDLKPESVDKHPEKYPPLVAPCLSHRSGHFVDPVGAIAVFGIRACDTSGEEWFVCENEEGVYKKSTERTGH